MKKFMRKTIQIDKYIIVFASNILEALPVGGKINKLFHGSYLYTELSAFQKSRAIAKANEQILFHILLDLCRNGEQ